MTTFSKVTWASNAPPAINGTNLNRLENGLYDAHFEIDAAQTEITNARGGEASLDARLDAVDTQLAQKASLAELTEKTSYGVVSGLGVTAQASPNMTVIVATGVIWMAAGTRFAPTANNALAITAADATNPRIDIIYINSSGVIAYLAGTPGATPAQPSTPAGGQVIATVLVTAGKTSILTADIADRRKNMWSEAWITPTLLNGWVAFDSERIPQYCKTPDGGVHFRGTLKSGTIGSKAFDLPTGYRAAAWHYIPNISNGVLGVIYLKGSEFIPAVGSNLRFELFGTSFMQGV